MSILIENNVVSPSKDHDMSDSSSTVKENDSNSKSEEDKVEDIENHISEKQSDSKSEQKPEHSDSSLMREMNFMRNHFFEPT